MGIRSGLIHSAVLGGQAGSGGVVWAGPSGNLTHRWPMDDANVSGTTITDVVGTLHGTAGSSVSSGTGPVTQARVIADDANGYITLPSSPIADLTAAWSFGGFLMKTNVADGAFDGDPRFFCFSDGTHTAAGADSAAQIGVDIDSGGTAGSSHLAMIANSTWAHVVFTHAAGASVFTIYKDGSSVSDSGALADATTATNALGARGLGARPWGGGIYQFVTYSKELSAGEVSTLFAAN